ncbi:MAG TPA: hypothetical protein PKD10_08725, partial [Paracoccaceae bacterium]|nr:hypothetical protein [Paracoccaceae bacterium]
MTTTAITGTLILPDNLAAAFVRLTFERRQPGVAPWDGQAVAAVAAEVVTGEDGAIALYLVPGSYIATAHLPAGPMRFGFTVRDQASMDFNDGLVPADVPVPHPTLVAAEAARDGAQAAQAAAVAAQAGAEDARDDAVAARDVALGTMPNTLLALVGGVVEPYAARASGGTQSHVQVGPLWYRLHTFTAGGTLTVTRAGSLEYLVVGGGGGGAGATGSPGGGGGGGGVRAGATLVSPGAIAVTVGAGGAGGVSSAMASAQGTSGGASALGSIASVVGGGGGGRVNSAAGSGGSGGGGGSASSDATTPAGGAGTAGEGNAGGTGFGAATGALRAGGGGGGATAAGGNAASALGGNGGAGGCLVPSRPAPPLWGG